MKYIKQFEANLPKEENKNDYLDSLIDKFLIENFKDVIDGLLGYWQWNKDEKLSTNNKYAFTVSVKPAYKNSYVNIGLFVVKPELNQDAFKEFIEDLTVKMMETFEIFSSVEYKVTGSLKRPKVSDSRNDVKDEYLIICELKEGIVRGIKTGLWGLKTEGLSDFKTNREE